MKICVWCNKSTLSINRNVDNSQEITKDIITGALNGSMTIDNRLFTSDGRSSIANDFKNLPDNAIIATEGALNMPIAGPIWWSKYIDRNNDNINEKTGEKEERGQPTFETGDKNPYDPSVGIGTKSCREGKICGPLFSDQGWLKYLDEDVPGFSDFSAFHDNHMSKVENVIGETASIPVKVISIPVYLGVYYYGAVGTQLENGINYLKNRTYNSKSVVIKK